MQQSEFKKKRQLLIRTANNFPEDKLEKCFYGNWSIKEVIGHISAWDQYFTDLLKNFTKGKAVEHWGNVNQFNEIQTQKRKSKNFEQLLAELDKSGKQFIDAYKNVPNILLSSKIWKDRSTTPESILKIQTHHYESQEKQIHKRY